MFTLVPSRFFDPSAEREILAEVGEVGESDIIKHISIPQYDAVLIYNQDEDSVLVSSPEIHTILEALPSCRDYNKIVCSIRDWKLYIAIAQGKSLLLANSYRIQDFTTAEYYIFLAMKSLQLNPQMSTICWMTPLGADEEMSLYRYFKAVEQKV